MFDVCRNDHPRHWRTRVMSILVTGSAGFIGSNFIRLMINETDERLVSYDALTYAGNLDNLTGISDTRHQFVRGDICNIKKLNQVLTDYDVSSIVHFAAESHMDRSIDGPADFIDTNIIGTFSLLEVVRKLGNIHFHHVSTDEVYGSLGETGLFTEETPYDPRSPYSASKAASDHLVNAYLHTYGISCTLSNCSNNYGPFQFPEKLIPLMTLNCFNGKDLPIYGDGKNVRDWLYVDDHVDAIWLVLEKGRNGENYNVGGDCELRNIDLIDELIKSVAQCTGKELGDLEALKTYVTDRPGHDRRYAIDFSKINSELGWSPKHTFVSGLLETVQWYQANPQWIEQVLKKS